MKKWTTVAYDGKKKVDIVFDEAGYGKTCKAMGLPEPHSPAPPPHRSPPTPK